MRVLVTGATGTLGRAMVARVGAAGLAVRAASRRPRPAGDGVEWVVADLATGAGVAEAVRDVDTVIHLACAPYRGRYTDRVELDGTRLLLDAARDSGVRHLVYPSIIGADRVPWGYFRTKVRAEHLVRGGAVPWSIIRLAQFHPFVDTALRRAARLGVLPVDRAITAQPVDVRDAADRLYGAATAGPRAGVDEFAGPEVLTMADAARQWCRARGVRRPLLPIRVPGALGRAFRAGHLTTTARPTGTITWRDYLSAQHPVPGAVSDARPRRRSR